MTILPSKNSEFSWKLSDNSSNIIKPFLGIFVYQSHVAKFYLEMFIALMRITTEEFPRKSSPRGESRRQLKRYFWKYFSYIILIFINLSLVGWSFGWYEGWVWGYRYKSWRIYFVFRVHNLGFKEKSWPRGWHWWISGLIMSWMANGTPHSTHTVIGMLHILYTE